MQASLRYWLTCWTFRKSPLLLKSTCFLPQTLIQSIKSINWSLFLFRSSLCNFREFWIAAGCECTSARRTSGAFGTAFWGCSKCLRDRLNWVRLKSIPRLSMFLWLSLNFIKSVCTCTRCSWAGTICRLDRFCEARLMDWFCISCILQVPFCLKAFTANFSVTWQD